jgi:hypothetical protein
MLAWSSIKSQMTARDYIQFHIFCHDFSFYFILTFLSWACSLSYLFIHYALLVAYVARSSEILTNTFGIPLYELLWFLSFLKIIHPTSLPHNYWNCLVQKNWLDTVFLFLIYVIDLRVLHCFPLFLGVYATLAGNDIELVFFIWLSKS